MPASPNLIGEKFTKLTVIEKLNKRKNYSVVWKCQCDCGNYCEVTTSDLLEARVKSCGCYNIDSHLLSHDELIGKQFNNWTVLDYSGKNKKRERVWKVQCKCGNIGQLTTNQLTSGASKSCGCLMRIKNSGPHINRRKIKIGDVFGKLTIIATTDECSNNKRRSPIYICKCECGNIIKSSGNELLRGHKISCGCLKSKGEYTISKILTEANIYFEEQKTFKDCVFSDTKYCAIFDFYVDNNYIIEYDGMQHFAPVKFNAEISHDQAMQIFIKTQEHDKIKNEYCFINNIPIIRIPYTHNNITLEDLLLTSTNFLVNKDN